MSDLSQTQRATEKRKASLPFTLDDGRVDQELIFSIYDRLDTGIWIFDFDEKCIVWANRKALEITDAESLEELRARDMGSDMSHSV